MLDGLSQNRCTPLKFIHRDEFSGPVCFTNVAGADHDCLAPERHHLRRFSAERYSS